MNNQTAEIANLQQLIADLRTLTKQARRQGAEEMRERCAEIIEATEPLLEWVQGKLVKTIRALPLPGDKP